MLSCAYFKNSKIYPLHLFLNIPSVHVCTHHCHKSRSNHTFQRRGRHWHWHQKTTSCSWAWLCKHQCMRAHHWQMQVQPYFLQLLMHAFIIINQQNIVPQFQCRCLPQSKCRDCKKHHPICNLCMLCWRIPGSIPKHSMH